MDIIFLGTGAAEGWPGLFCNCKACREARKLGGKNIRTRSSILVDNILKIDFPPDSYYHFIKYKIIPIKIKYIFITHSHSDHLAFQEMEYLKYYFAYRGRAKPIEIFGNEEVIEKIKPYIDKFFYGRLNLIKPFKTIKVGPYNVTPIKANHSSDKLPLNYIIKKDKKSILYACDTGFYEPSTWDFLRENSVNLDLVISECTAGYKNVKYGTHMGIPNILKFKYMCEKIGIANCKTKWILTHFSHNSKLLYNELRSYTTCYKFEIAYDGMKIKI